MGLQAEVGPASPVSPYVFQNNETNLAFLRGRAASLGYALYMDGKVLHFEPPHDPGDPIELIWADTLLEFPPRLTTLEQTTKLAGAGTDPATRQEIFGEARHGNGRPAIGESRDPGDLARAPSNWTRRRRPPTAPSAPRRRPSIRPRPWPTGFRGGSSKRKAPAVAIPARCRCLGQGGQPRPAIQRDLSGDLRASPVQPRPGVRDRLRRVRPGAGEPAPHPLLRPEEPRALITGLAIGIVTDNHDPDGPRASSGALSRACPRSRGTTGPAWRRPAPGPIARVSNSFPKSMTKCWWGSSLGKCTTPTSSAGCGTDRTLRLG